MKNARVSLYGITGKYATVNLDATEGATVGRDLHWPDGSTVTEAQLRNSTSSGPPSSGASTTDEVDEGQFNFYFTTQRAQDAVGSILTDTDTIDFTYNGTTHVVKADLKDLSSTTSGSLVGISRDGKGRVSGTKPVVPGDGIGIVDSGSVISISLVGLPVYLIDEASNQLVDESDDPLVDTSTTGLPTPFSNITDTPTTLAGYGITDAQKLGDPIAFPAYTLGTLPSAAANQWKAIVVTDLTGGAEPCLSDGTNWRRFSDRSIAS